eukprot:2150293-Pyramimonas_sp.AAC.1
MRQPPPSTALAPCVFPTQYSVPVASPACVRHRPAQPLLPSFHPPSAAFRGPIGNSTEGLSGTARM